MDLRFRDRCHAYVEPLWYLMIAAYGSALPPIFSAPPSNGLTCLGALIALMRIVSHKPSDLLSIRKVKHAVFAEFWLRMGKVIPASCSHTSDPVHDLFFCV